MRGKMARDRIARAGIARDRIAAVLVLISVMISSVLCSGCTGSQRKPDSDVIPKIDVNEDVVMGRFGDQDIEWMVLDVQDGKALLLSKYVIDSRAFNTSNRKINWKLCILRTWLNTDFYVKSFTTGEQKIILKTTLAEDDTEDRIFLLSEEELIRYFPETKPEPRAFPTRYAMDQGVELLTDGSCRWWLRTSGHEGNCALTADDSSTTSTKVTEKCYGVRPAMWVSIET